MARAPDVVKLPQSLVQEELPVWVFFLCRAYLDVGLAIRTATLMLTLVITLCNKLPGNPQVVNAAVQIQCLGGSRV